MFFQTHLLISASTKIIKLILNRYNITFRPKQIVEDTFFQDFLLNLPMSSARFSFNFCHILKKDGVIKSYLI